MMNENPQEQLLLLVTQHLEFIYSAEDYPAIDYLFQAKRLIAAMGLDESCQKIKTHENHWNEEDVVVITYGDSITSDKKEPLASLYDFCHRNLKSYISSVHVLPFFPYSSDDGFAVIDYTQVNDGLGGWEHIVKIASEYRLMADLVINHCSSRSRWFEDFKLQREPGMNYFFEASPDVDLSQVVRPRTSPLLRKVETSRGDKYVWCTFGHDQVDLNFSNPDVLWEIVGIIKLYLDRGVSIFRLDAIAFAWKEIGTRCINHPKTHEIVRLIRTLLEYQSFNNILITETNIPNPENLSYFGNANEAHAVYNFSLPPLLLHALTHGTSNYLKTWQMSMPPAQFGTFYFNFIASHDGIGLRPAEGILSEEDINSLVVAMDVFGAKISWRTGDGGQQRPYEINVALYDALQGTVKGADSWQMQRYICAHTIMLALEGIPAFYIHSLLATKNNDAGVAFTGHNRTINRYKWDAQEVQAQLDDSETHHSMVFFELTRLLGIRKKQPAFHPNATQFTLHLGDEVFGFWRQSFKRDQSIFCINNVSDQEVVIPFSAINLVNLNRWVDLISGVEYVDFQGALTLAPYQSVWLSNK